MGYLDDLMRQCMADIKANPTKPEFEPKESEEKVNLKERIIEYDAQGLSRKEIKAEVRCSLNYISVTLHKNRIKNANKIQPSDDVAELITEYHTNKEDNIC